MREAHQIQTQLAYNWLELDHAKELQVVSDLIDQGQRWIDAGGGFATVPAYLRDLFGTFQVGAIHGRLLTAWSLAGILGQSAHGLANLLALDPEQGLGRHGFPGVG